MLTIGPAAVFIARELASLESKRRAFLPDGSPSDYLEHLLSRALLIGYAWELCQVEPAPPAPDLGEPAQEGDESVPEPIGVPEEDKPASPAQIKKLKAFHEGPEYSGEWIKSLFHATKGAAARKRLTSTYAKELIAGLTGECNSAALDELRTLINNGDYPPEIGMDWLKARGHEDIEPPMQMSLRQQLMDLYATGEIGKFEKDGVK